MKKLIFLFLLIPFFSSAQFTYKQLLDMKDFSYVGKVNIYDSLDFKITNYSELPTHYEFWELQYFTDQAYANDPHLKNIHSMCSNSKYVNEFGVYLNTYYEELMKKKEVEAYNRSLVWGGTRQANQGNANYTDIDYKPNPGQDRRSNTNNSSSRRSNYSNSNSGSQKAGSWRPYTVTRSQKANSNLRK